MPCKLNKAYPIAPGGTIGILGGGQLGRMLAIGAARLGYKTHVFCPEEIPPARQVVNNHTCADYKDKEALKSFAQSVDVVTIEFENIPYESVKLISEYTDTHPHWDVLRIAQNRLHEKNYLSHAKIALASYVPVTNKTHLQEGIKNIGLPAVLKTTAMGYDGKGQYKITSQHDLPALYRQLGEEPFILEKFVDFTQEISVITARSQNGETATYIPVLNDHRNHILDKTTAPAPLDERLIQKSIHMAEQLSLALSCTGLLAVEMFVTKDNQLLVNEIAPRPHNSGHWTLDACSVNQFEQCIRAICGLPLGSPERHSNAVMKNLIGKEVDSWPELVATPGVCLHLYGKKDAHPGRKMGHFTKLLPISQPT